MNLVELIQNRDRINAAIQEEMNRHTTEHARLIVELQQTTEKIMEHRKGFDADLIERAEAILSVTGDWSYLLIGEGPKMLQDAISETAAGSDKLLSEFYGVKNYSGFTAQRCDCQYGYGPRHGGIVLSIGLTRDRRESEGRRDVPGPPLSEAEREAAVYYLNNLVAIGRARAAASTQGMQ